MSAHAEKGSNGHDHAHPSYIVIWVLLVLLFVASLGFSHFTSLIVGVVFAFFIAIVKALMVCAWFMHLNVERRYVWVMMFLSLGAVLVMWMGIAPDVMENRGHNWTKSADLKPITTEAGKTGH